MMAWAAKFAMQEGRLMRVQVLALLALLLVLRAHIRILAHFVFLVMPARVLLLLLQIKESLAPSAAIVERGNTHSMMASDAKIAVPVQVHFFLPQAKELLVPSVGNVLQVNILSMMALAVNFAMQAQRLMRVQVLALLAL